MIEATYNKIYRFDKEQGIGEITDLMIVEKKVDLTVNEKYYAAFYCTPTHLDELMLGSLALKGKIHSCRDIKKIEIKGYEVNINIATEPSLNRYPRGRKTFITRPVKAEDVLFLMQTHLKSSELHTQTGGVHVMSIAKGREILLTREDIGRHNAVDKIFGKCFMNNITLEDKIFLSSGRITHEIINKLIAMGPKIVVSRAAISTKAMECAEKEGVTLIGFAREQRFNIYTHPQRVCS